MSASFTPLRSVLGFSEQARRWVKKFIQISEKDFFKALFKPYSQRVELMVYKLLCDLVIMLHLLWIIFILFGLILAVKYFKTSYIHMAGLGFTLVLNLGGWYCPLTYLENYLHSLYDPQVHYSGSFITNNLQKLIYLELDEVYLRMGAIAWVGLNTGGYVLLLRRRLCGSEQRARRTAHNI